METRTIAPTLKHSRHDLLSAVRKHLEQRGTAIPGWNAVEHEVSRFRAAVAEALVELEHPDYLIPRTAEDLTGMMAGLGVLQQLLEEPGVEEVMVRKGHVLVEKEGRVEARGRVADDEYFLALARRAADMGGRAMWGDRPFVLVDLPGGHRFTAMIPPLSVEGTTINIRVHRQTAFTVGELGEMGTFEPPGPTEGRKDGDGGVDAVGELLWAEGVDPPAPPAVDFLARAIHEGLASIIVSGEFSSGKTTLLGALLRLVPPEHVLAVVETFRELKVSHPYGARAVVPEILEQSGGLPGMREVVNVLYTRMRPDIIVFGEVVGDEAVPLLDAMNLGKRVLTTIHGDSAYGALLRLEMLAMASGLPLAAIQERVGRGIDLVVHMEREGHRRYVSEVALVEGYDASESRYRLRHLCTEREGAARHMERLLDLWRSNCRGREGTPCSQA